MRLKIEAIIMMQPCDETKTTQRENEFKDFMQHGDDFFKIELWRPAKAWYKRALDLNIDSEKVRNKIAECDRLMAYEVRVIWILVAIAALIVLMILLLS